MEGEPGTFGQGRADWKIDDISASANDCSIDYKEQNGRPIHFLLHRVEKVMVDAWARLHDRVRSEPAVYEVDVQMQDQPDVRKLEFTDQRTAQRVAKAIAYASTLCKSQLVAMKQDDADDTPY